MKHAITMLSHMLASGSVVLLFSTWFDSQLELFAYAFVAALLAGICYVVRQKVQGLMLFIGSHLLLAMLGFVLVPVLAFAKMYLVMWILLIVWSGILCLIPQAEMLEYPGYSHVGVPAVVYFGIALFKGARIAQTACIVIAVLLYLLNLLYDNIESMEEFIETRSISTELEENRMKRLNMRFSFMYVGGLGAILGVFGALRIESVRNFIFHCFGAILKFFLLLFPASKAEEQAIIDEKQGDMADVMEKVVTEQEPSLVSQYVDEFFKIVVIVALVALLLWSIISAVWAIYHYFYNKGEKKIKGENEFVERLSDKEHIRKHREKRFFERFERNPARRIRKMYKKKMKRFSAKQEAKLQFMSPEEQVKILREQGFEEDTIAEIRELYEKARYSAETVSDGEAERFRAMM